MKRNKRYFMHQYMSYLKYFWEKIFLTIPFSVFFFTQQEYLIVWSLIFIIIIDTFLGIWVSIKYKKFSSHRLSRFASKIVRYALALLTVRILQCVSPNLFGWTFDFIGIFLVLTEVFSNFEKLALLGLEIPKKFLSELNENFYHFYYGDEEKKKEAIKVIINKE